MSESTERALDERNDKLAQNDLLLVTKAPLPAVSSLLETETLVHEIARAYQLNPPTRGTLLRSWTNDVYEITSDRQRYILKVYRANWHSSQDVAWEVDLQSYLAQHGAGVMPVIARPDGQLFGTIRAPEGVRCVALFGYAGGDKPIPPFTPDLFYRYGSGTARLYQVSEGFSSRHERFALDLSGLLDDSLAVLRPWFAKRSDDWSLVMRIAETIREKIEAHSLQGLDWGVCIGDLSLDNLHVTSTGHLTFYDFDLSCYGWRAWDVCNVFAYATPENWDAFLEGYSTLRSFSEAERAALPYFSAAEILHSMAGEMSRWTQWFGTSRVVDWVDDKLVWLRKWEAAPLFEK